MKDGKFEACDIYDLLLKKYEDGRQWVCAGEVANTTGGGMRRLDFVACNCYESQGYGINAFEIKISKSDLRRELEDPTKHNIFFDDIDTYSVVAPEYVLDAEYKALVPKNWGIYVARTIGVMKDGKEVSENVLRTVRKPLALHDGKDRTMRRDFAMSMLRSITAKSKLCYSMQTLLWNEHQDGYKEGFEEGKRQDWERRTLEDTLKREQENNRAMNALMKELNLWGTWQVDEAKERLEKARKFVKGAKETWHWMELLSQNLPDMLKAAEALRAVCEKNEDTQKGTEK